MEGGAIPFERGAFGLVTCFDVVEHLDEVDLPALRDEMVRVIRPGGWLCLTVALRPAAAVDHEGRNAHRTVRPLGWWIELFDPDEATVYCRRQNAILWRRIV
jgi:SAM-dependent methyltransferase